MKLLLNIAVLTIIIASCQYEKPSKVRFDGLYQTEPLPRMDTTRMYLRFYPNGKVIAVTSTGGAFKITSWFNLESGNKNENVAKGTYNVSKNKIDFSTTIKSGTLIYEGKIVDENHLELEVKSLINGHKAAEKFSFVKIPDLK